MRRPQEDEPLPGNDIDATARTWAKRIWARPWLLATAAAFAGMALAGGCALNAADPADNSGSRSLPGAVACAETIAVGNVTSTSRHGERFAVTLDAVRYLKPESGSAVLSIRDARLPIGGSSTEPAKGERALVVVHDAAKGQIDLFTGADIDPEWAWMEKALPDSRSIDPKGCDGE